MRNVHRDAGTAGLAAAAVIVVGTLLQSVLPEAPWVFAFYIVAGILFLIWFAWTGAALRRAHNAPDVPP